MNGEGKSPALWSTAATRLHDGSDRPQKAQTPDGVADEAGNLLHPRPELGSLSLDCHATAIIGTILKLP